MNSHNFFKISIPLSSILVLSSLIVIMTRGFNYGSDFTGGAEALITFNDSKFAEEKDTITTLVKKIATSSQVQPVLHSTPRFLIRMGGSSAVSSDSPLVEILQKQYGTNSFSLDQFRFVGGIVGERNKKSGLWALLFSIISVALYLSIRFQYQFGIGAVVALLHDILIMLCVICITGQEVTVFTISAVLTIFGYSVNDTIVVYDRIREELSHKGADTLTNCINRSIVSVLPRTIVTSLTTLCVLISLVFLTSGMIRDFSLALSVGIVVGTYSSIFVAVPVLLILSKIFPVKISSQ